jgi:hypothetical protein
MPDERAELDVALNSATNRTPFIIRGIVHAKQGSKPQAWRRAELAKAISQARALYDDLLLSQVRLGWHDREGDAA